ncbi:Protein of unknown function [Bacillus mycoides]
MSSEL